VSEDNAPAAQPGRLRALSVVLGLVALAGWGAFAYAAQSSATAQRQLRDELTQLRQELAQLRTTQQNLAAERDNAKAQAAQSLAERDDARRQLEAVQQDAGALRKRLSEFEAKASVTGGTLAPGPAPSAPARTPARRRSR